MSAFETRHEVSLLCLQTVGHRDVSVTVLLSQLQEARRLLDEVTFSCIMVDICLQCCIQIEAAEGTIYPASGQE